MSKVRMVLYGIAGALLTVGIWSFIGGCQSSSGPATGEIGESEPITRKTESLSVGESAPEMIPTPAPPPAPPAPPAPASAEEVSGKESIPPEKSVSASVHNYTVKKGDTLWGISRTYGVTLKELTEINKLDKPGSLKIGQKLIVPGEPATKSGNSK